jgi:hypothetical protein
MYCTTWWIEGKEYHPNYHRFSNSKCQTIEAFSVPGGFVWMCEVALNFRLGGFADHFS